MSDYSEIKQLAEAAIPVNSELLGDRYLCGAGSIAKLDAAQSKFYEVATPALVVSLIKDLESHKRMLLAAACDIGAIGKALKADMDADGDELLGMVIDLKAQNTRMMEWLKDISRTSGDKGAVMGARQLLKEFSE